MCIALDISKAFHRVWYKALASKLPSYVSVPFICTFITSFYSGRSIDAVVDGHHSLPQVINSKIPQGFVLYHLHLLILINDLLKYITNPIHSHADDSTFHYSTRLQQRPSQQALEDPRGKANEHVNSDLTKISDWGIKILVTFNASKTQFFHLFTRHNLPHNHPIFFNNTRIDPSSSLNMLRVSFSQDFS